jgi:hypothetical protein
LGLWARRKDSAGDWSAEFTLIFGGPAGVASGSQAPQLIGYATIDPTDMDNTTNEMAYRGRGNSLVTVFNTATEGGMRVTTGSSTHSDIAGRYTWVINDERVIPQGGIMSKFLLTGWSGPNLTMFHRYWDGTTFAAINYTQNTNSFVTIELWQNY